MHAGKLQYFFNNWKLLTSDKVILSWIKRYRPPFKCKIVQKSVPPEPHLSTQEFSEFCNAVNLSKASGAIEKCKPVNDQFISSIFLVKKSNGTNRLILNLKNLNRFLSIEHFKMEDRRTAAKLVSPGCFMGKLDLKEAYFLIPVCPTDRKYLRFKFNDILYQFTCLPFGLCSAPYIFTKLLKPLVNFLRLKDHMSVVYLDDFLTLLILVNVILIIPLPL